jgi:hypothetical protein
MDSKKASGAFWSPSMSPQNAVILQGLSTPKKRVEAHDHSNFNAEIRHENSRAARNSVSAVGSFRAVIF